MDAYDVVVIGGGPAGLSGAIALARSRRSVLVIDGGEPRNAPADGIHNLLGHDGVSPLELLATGRDELARYGGTCLSGDAVAVTGERDAFVVETADGRRVGARRLLVTTGLVDVLPEVDGLRARWGRDVLHCPYCHGWEVRDQPIGVLATGEKATHQATLFRQLSDDVTVFTNGTAFTPDQLADLASRDIAVVDGTVTAVVVTDDRLTGVLLEDGTVVPRAALAVAPRFVARSSVLDSLGITATPHPMGVGEYVESDELGRTSVPGVFVAGNVTDLMAQVSTSAAAGLMAGASINADLLGLLG